MGLALAHQAPWVSLPRARISGLVERSESDIVGSGPALRPLAISHLQPGPAGGSGAGRGPPLAATGTATATTAGAGHGWTRGRAGSPGGARLITWEPRKGRRQHPGRSPPAPCWPTFAPPPPTFRASTCSWSGPRSRPGHRSWWVSTTASSTARRQPLTGGLGSSPEVSWGACSRCLPTSVPTFPGARHQPGHGVRSPPSMTTAQAFAAPIPARAQDLPELCSPGRPAQRQPAVWVYLAPYKTALNRLAKAARQPASN